jgi:hypothetical protein
LFSSPIIITENGSIKMRWAGHVAQVGEDSNAFGALVVKLNKKRPLGRT